jgi:DNA-binding protein HU-beta
MTKQDVLHRISEQTGIDPHLSRSIIDSFFEVIKEAVSEGETIYIRQFGSFGPKQRARKIGRNISANTALVIEAHSIPSFKPSAEFVHQVRSSKANRKQAKK